VEGYFDSFTVLAGFSVGVVVLLIIDLVVLSGKDHHVGMREATLLTIFWTLLAGGVGVWVWVAGGTDLGVEYATAYVAERALSIDNLFVFLVIFNYFALPDLFRSRALLFGIVGALIARAVFIFFAIGIISVFEPVLYLLAAVLIFTAYKLITSHGDEVDPSKNIVVRGFRKVFPVTDEYDGHNFFTIRNGVRAATPFALVVLVLASTDVVFAIDSIPTVVGISKDQFIIWSSNAMAVLGMRPLFFLLEGLVNLFRFLSYGLAAILAFIGVKIIVETGFHDQFHGFVHALGVSNDQVSITITLASLAIVIALLISSVVASVVLPQSKDEHQEHDEAAA
jgi:tellurite resistance protein TerC